jgi:hypothetical protein
MTWERQSTPPTNREVRDTQVDPTAGIWFCQNCGRHIQVITDSDVPKRQPFVCVCGTRMTPGEEHATLEPDASQTVDD